MLFDQSVPQAEASRPHRTRDKIDPDGHDSTIINKTGNYTESY